MNDMAWHLPWNRMEDVPHALLDILRGCNICCDSCYNKSEPHQKTVAEVEKELETLMKFRKLQSVSIIGGEVTLHPGLCDIVRMVKSHGLCTEVFTNGLLLDPPLLKSLADAGADLIFLHIDGGQKRPDLPDFPSAKDLRGLIHRKASLVANHGMDVGLTITAYADRTDEIIQSVETVIESPILNYLLVTLHRDHSGIIRIHGDLHSGLQGECTGTTPAQKDGLTIRDIAQLMKIRLQLEPFARIGSNIDKEDTRWLSYWIGSLHDNQILRAKIYLKASLCERLFLAVSHAVTGRYPMYQRQKGIQFRLQLLFNGMTGGRGGANLSFFLKSCRRGLRASSKRILFQCPAFVEDGGRVIHCKNCPDAVIKNGKLVPICLCDYVDNPE